MTQTKRLFGLLLLCAILLMPGTARAIDIPWQTDQKSNVSANLNVPAELTAEAGDRQVTLTWGKVPGAKKYKVARYLNGKYITLRSNNITGSYTVKRLQNGTEYGFAVAAYVGSGWSAYSAKVYATPAAGAGPEPVGAPAELTAEAWDRQVTLSWGEVPGAKKYRVARYLNGRYFTLRRNIITPAYTVKRLLNGTEYSFAVAAWVDGAWGPYSERVHITPNAAAGLPEPPQKPEAALPAAP